jgi:hypothetical protein
MKVRLTQKLSELIDGVDLSKANKGDTLDLTENDARTLIAEGWAAPLYGGRRPDRDRAHDKPRSRRTPGQKKR